MPHRHMPHELLQHRNGRAGSDGLDFYRLSRFSKNPLRAKSTTLQTEIDMWQAGQREEALEAYSRLIRPGRLLDGVITDLEGYVRQQPDVSVQRVLGDAYMKVGRLQEALSLYRRALETL